MRALLDTCTFLWILTDAEALSPEARRVVRDPANEIYLSAASAWEIAIKHSLGRLTLPAPPERFIPAQREHHGITPLPVDEEAILYGHRLPPLHQDPFDRALVCQAIVHGLAVLTPDSLIEQYAVRCLW